VLRAWRRVRHVAQRRGNAMRCGLPQLAEGFGQGGSDLPIALGPLQLKFAHCFKVVHDRRPLNARWLTWSWPPEVFADVIQARHVALQQK
jgi:hypothetical protein